jgi:hypothetical protein
VKQNRREYAGVRYVEKKEAILRFNLCDNIICNSNKNKLCVENVFSERERMLAACSEAEDNHRGAEGIQKPDRAIIEGKNSFCLKQQRSSSRILLFHLRGSGAR